MWRHYVYIHCRADDGQPFYVGKGSRRLRDKARLYERAHADSSRSKEWRAIVAAHGLLVEILASCRCDAEAQRIEMDTIGRIGRRDLGLGPLINVTDGGDGHAGIIVSAQLRASRSKNASGKRSEAWVKSIRVARKNGGNGGVVKKGDRLPPEWVRSISEAKKGTRNPVFGKPSAVSKKVVNMKTGRVYDSISRAAAAEGISVARLYGYLDGSRRNPTFLVKL